MRLCLECAPQTESTSSNAVCLWPISPIGRLGLGLAVPILAPLQLLAFMGMHILYANIRRTSP
jgi:hypothetical protein